MSDQIEHIETRRAALDLAVSLVASGIPIHPRERDRLVDILGELSPEEEERLEVATRARDAHEARMQDDLHRMTEDCRELVQRMGMS